MQARSCAVSSDMLEEVRERESKAKAALEAKQSRLAKLGADAKLQEYTLDLRNISSKLQSIRQVLRDPEIVCLLLLTAACCVSCILYLPWIRSHH